MKNITHAPARVRRATTAALALLGGAVLAGTIAAGPANAEPADGAVLVILDVSGSMQRDDGTGTTLMQGARDAVAALLDDLPDETPVGLRLYGASYAGNNERQGCRDTELAVPIGPAGTTGSRIERAVDRARPTGFTPIGGALAAAAGDFGPEGQRTIILVSDGEDTCGSPAPCQAARRLAAQDIDVRVDTIGLRLQGDRAAQQQLRCVADATGGSFVTADDTAALTREMTAASTRAVQRYETAGESVAGGPALTQATPVEPGTAYTDSVVGGEARWYSFEAGEGQGVRLVLTEDGSVEHGCCLELRVIDPEGSGLRFENGFNRAGTAETYIATVDELGASGTHYVQVSLTADDATGSLPYDFTLEVSGDGAEEPTEEPSPSEEPTPEAAETEDAEDTEAIMPASDGGTPTWLYLALGILALAVLALGGAVVVLLRRVTATDRG